MNGWEVVSTYTRAQAIDDGVLVDVSAIAREAGFTVPVAVTAAVWNLIEPTEEEKRVDLQDVQGRLWDLVFIASHVARAAKDRGGEILFRVIFRLRGRGKALYGRRKLVFKLHSGPGDDGEHVITILLPEED